MRVANRRTYDRSFREDCVSLLRRSDRPLAVIAQDLGVSPSTLRYWYEADMAKKGKKVRGARLADPAAESSEEKVLRLETEVAALRRENEELKLDRAILKKAAAFFAKESE